MQAPIWNTPIIVCICSKVPLNTNEYIWLKACFMHVYVLRMYVRVCVCFCLNYECILFHPRPCVKAYLSYLMRSCGNDFFFFALFFLRREFAELLEKYGSNSSTGSTRNSPIQQGITHTPTPSSSPKSRWYDPSLPEVQRGMTLTRLHLS